MFNRVIPRRSVAVAGWCGTLRTLQATRSVSGALYVEQLEASARKRFDAYWSEMTEAEREELRWNLRHLARGEA